MEKSNWKEEILLLAGRTKFNVMLENWFNAPIQIYPRSITQFKNNIFFIGKRDIEKHLYILTENPHNDTFSEFSGEIISLFRIKDDLVAKKAHLIHGNAEVLRYVFEFTKPKIIGFRNSFGLGDRLGIANPAHIRAIRGSLFKPILAQQSIRELDRTERSPEDVLDAASWAVFQEGYREEFGADADHLKTTNDIDRMVPAGYTMITIDPGDYVVNKADHLSKNELKSYISSLPWDLLHDTSENFIKRYENCTFDLGDGISIYPTEEETLRAIVKYGGVIAHTLRMFLYLKEKYPGKEFEIELSVDETESVTSAFEHLMIANELKRLGVELISLAPRFVGDFEKGIDYKGNLEEFRRAYLLHLRIAQRFGPYKISFHSGSDKFSIYQTIGKISEGKVHIKTAGTSYLEALRTIAEVDQDLFREILNFCKLYYPEEKKSYHVSAQLDRVPSGTDCNLDQLIKLFDQDDARQVLHVTYGRVLTERGKDGKYMFRDRLMQTLLENEKIYYTNLINHFQKHIRPFIEKRVQK